MPVLSSRSPAVVDLASKLVADMNGGRSARASFGAKDVAFAWTRGLPSIIAPHMSTHLVEGSGYTAVMVRPAGDPDVVAEGGTKPTLATVGSGWVAMKKWAGLATFPVERAVEADALATAVSHVLVSQALIGYDKAVAAELDAGAQAAGSGSTWSKAILAGIADVVANGAQPDTVIMAGDVYAAAVESPGAGFLLDPREGVPTLFGLKLVVSAGAPAGKAWVVDSSAVQCGEDKEGPYVVVDAFTGLSTNTVTVAAEIFGTVLVANEGGVAALTVA